MILAGKEAIRDVIAFPEVAVGERPTDRSPGPIDAAQLRARPRIDRRGAGRTARSVGAAGRLT